MALRLIVWRSNGWRVIAVRLSPLMPVARCRAWISWSSRAATMVSRPTGCKPMKLKRSRDVVRRRRAYASIQLSRPSPATGETAMGSRSGAQSISSALSWRVETLWPGCQQSVLDGRHHLLPGQFGGSVVLDLCHQLLVQELLAGADRPEAPAVDQCHERGEV